MDQANSNKKEGTKWETMYDLQIAALIMSTHFLHCSLVEERLKDETVVA